ncbi:hypothetical protein MMC21_004406 [Puttea exsequens]|nr:hypothetical protein [Puttea exsequens]
MESNPLVDEWNQPMMKNASPTIVGKVTSLKASNLAQSTQSAESKPSIEEKEGQLTVQRLESRISPAVYMQEVWEAASSAPTSIMSEGTRKGFNAMRASGMVWQDRHMKFVEHFAKLGKAAALRELLQAGCNPGYKDKPRTAPLLIAVKGGSQRHNKCVRALLDAGANVNARLAHNKTVLHYAIEHDDFKGYTNLIRDLLEAGANPNVKDKSGDFPLLQILYGGYEPLEKHKRDALACLLQKEFDTDVNIMPPGTLNMPLHLAVRRKDPWAVGLLLNRGAKVNTPNGSGQTPLMLAAATWGPKESHNQNEILRFLLEAGVNVNEQPEPSRMTALHLAISQGYETGVTMLLSKGAKSHCKNNEGKSPFNSACQPVYVKVMGRKKHWKLTELLLASMGRPPVAFSEDRCAVVAAVADNRVDDANFFFDRGADPNHIFGSADNVPLLHVALKAGHLAMARLLVSRGATVDAEDPSGLDAFQVCAATEQTSDIKDLLQYMKEHGKRKAPKQSPEDVDPPKSTS